MEKVVIPAILSDDIDEVRELLGRCEGVVERVQIDVIDGKFADNKTIDPSSLNDFETTLKIDYHLMVNEPVKWVEKCARSSADRIIGQIEKMENKRVFIGKVVTTSAKVGLAIDLESPIERLDEDLTKDLDVILLMSVKAGFGGQEFDQVVFKKVERLIKIRKGSKSAFKISIDGGIGPDTAKTLFGMGVDEVCVGKRIFEGDIKENISKFIS